MKQVAPRLQTFLALLTVAAFCGCPSPSPTLNVAPGAIDFIPTTNTASFRITNTGGGTLTWTIQEVARASADSPWTSQDVPWLEVEQTSGSTTNETDRVALNVSRDELTAGTVNNFAVRVNSNGGQFIVPLSITTEATLSVSPSSILLDTGATTANFVVSNTGPELAEWEVLFLTDPQNPNSTQPLPANITVSPNPGTTNANRSTPVVVNFPVDQGSFYLLVRSNSGTTVVSILIGTGIEGLTATPNPIRLFINGIDEGQGEQAQSTLRIANGGTTLQNWTLEVVALAAGTDVVPITATPSSGSTPAGGETEVAVRVTDVTEVEVGSGHYELRLRSGESLLRIGIIVEILPLPIITLSEPPEVTSQRPEISEISILDFGREEVQMQFYIANTGTRGSRLNFRITHEDQGVEEPLILDVNPIEGDTNGPEEIFFHPPASNLLIDAQAVAVTIDRGALDEDVEERIITVTAMDEDFENELEAVPPVELRVRVEQQPLKLEGALNRGRPPFVSRFVFLMRDSEGDVIPTQTQEQRDRLEFVIEENDVPLDIDETNQFVTGPENLRTNLVLMLDFTGSMYRAGTTMPQNPLEPGEALEQVKEAAKRFLDDLPPSYRVSLMYYNERQQTDRVIAPFSTDRGFLKTSLDNFELPASEFGASEIYDALLDAIARLEAEDPPETLPFDDADVRAVLFITDGRDTSSIADPNEVIDAADDAFVRLYPLGYSAGGSTPTGDLVALAEETGGHYYGAGNVLNLVTLLGNERALSVEPSTITGENRVFFKITNVGTSAVNWAITPSAGDPWIESVSPAAGTTLPGGNNTVQVNLNPAAATAGSTVEGTLSINSNNGVGSANIRMVVGNDNTAQSVTLELRDEPGRVWAELQNQIVLTYVTPGQDDGTYLVVARYEEEDGDTITGAFQEDQIFFPGDVRAGQVSMTTTGIFTDTEAAVDQVRAEVFVRADYVPRGINRFRMRFFLVLPDNIPTAAVAAFSQAEMTVELAPEGLLVSDDPLVPSWRLLGQGDGIYQMVTEQDNPLRYGAFGNLLKITITGLEDFVATFDGLIRQPEFLLGMRVDNDLYYAPATPGRPSQTKFFLYPGSHTNPQRLLSVSTASDVAPPAITAGQLATPGIDPEASGVWNRDSDGLPDFQDPQPELADFPGSLAFPSPLEINENQSSSFLLIQNTRLDTFTGRIVPSSVPAYMTLTFPAPATAEGSFTLAPGETQRVNITVNRTGLPGGTTRAELVLETDIFRPEEIPIIVVVAK